MLYNVQIVLFFSFTLSIGVCHLLSTPVIPQIDDNTIPTCVRFPCLRGTPAPAVNELPSGTQAIKMNTSKIVAILTFMFIQFPVLLIVL